MEIWMSTMKEMELLKMFEENHLRELILLMDKI